MCQEYKAPAQSDSKIEGPFAEDDNQDGHSTQIAFGGNITHFNIIGIYHNIVKRLGISVTR